MINNHETGFSLMELMVALVIVGILAAIAYPSYISQMQKTRRSDAQTALLTMEAHMEHYYTENNSYIGATPVSVGLSATSPGGYYTLSISNLTATTYTLTATPIVGGLQATDTCGALSITSTNIKGPSASCWGN